MHIAVVGLRGIPDVMGGIETHCAALLPRLLSEAKPGDLKITVLARRPYVAEPSEFQGVAQIPLWAPGNSRLETIVHTFNAVFYARFVLRADCIHLHGIGPALMAPWVRLLGVKLLFTHHGEDYKRQKWGRVAKSMLKMGEVLGITCAHRVITVSKSSAKALASRFPRQANRITYIPNGVTPPDTDVDPAPLLQDLGLSHGGFVITVGRLVPEKAQTDLIDAFERSGLGEAQPPFKLLIVGAADHDSPYSKDLVRRGSDTVIFSGRLPRDSVVALNREAALFVLPSYHEGLSIAALEALFTGVPVLLSDIEPNTDIGLPAGHYFKTGSVEDLAQKLSVDFETYSTTDFDHTVFDWDQIARQTLETLAPLAPEAYLPLRASTPAENPKGRL
ncbi:glycosyltransferase family 4 protein [Pseudoruegeria sp. SHC-113]|uniref:glycosyltransferase family 4 protein n=1 Tax=Pseudoruegeria sp. SHC-113 TaxID=2855439 RepID=UPI0021BB00DA|nr:glycosyltransferase family 4 protein [Pseudoruegeria sp. SHC-113]MCT8158634.1 glycosyltransferase family 4 protein [Pseudoruegeria sp. SHC-113]